MLPNYPPAPRPAPRADPRADPTPAHRDGGILHKPIRGTGDSGKEIIIPLRRLQGITSSQPSTIVLELDGRQIAKAIIQHSPGDPGDDGHLNKASPVPQDQKTEEKNQPPASTPSAKTRSAFQAPRADTTAPAAADDSNPFAEGGIVKGPTFRFDALGKNPLRLPRPRADPADALGDDGHLNKASPVPQDQKTEEKAEKPSTTITITIPANASDSLSHAIHFAADQLAKILDTDSDHEPRNG